MVEIAHDVGTDRQELLQILVRTGAFQYSQDKPFQLTSGETSPYYFDLRRLNGDPEGINSVAKTLYHAIQQIPNIKSVGGLESGSISIATAISQLSWIEHQKKLSNPLIASFFVRKKPKKYGARRAIEGKIVSPAVIIDDVVTSGMSALSAISMVREEGIECACLMAIVFRGTVEQRDTIEKEIQLRYIFDKDRIIEQFK